SPEETWEPVVAIILGSELMEAQMADIGRLVASGAVAVVTDADLPGARYRLRAHSDGTLGVDPLGLRVVPRGLAASELAAVGALLADAGAPPVVSERPAPRRDLVDTPFLEPDWELLVRLLGPVDVVDREGRAVEFERAKSLELVAWLAQHRSNPSRMG